MVEAVIVLGHKCLDATDGKNGRHNLARGAVGNKSSRLTDGRLTDQ
jgi:hypothetical protein